MPSSESIITRDFQIPDAIVSLWGNTNAEPDAGEKVDERGIGGSHDRLIWNITNPRLRVFLPEKPAPGRPACIICPGGGYAVLAIDMEGDDIARIFNRNGVAAFVLVYRLPDGTGVWPDSVPMPIQDVRRAIRMVRADSKKWNIDPDHIGIMGFSAGGHVASIAATQFDEGDASSNDPINPQSSRPNFAVLMYPVISMHDPVAHVGSRENLLGKEATAEAMNHFSADQNITKQTPPLFIVHAEDDAPVPVQNSLQLAAAAHRAGVPCEVLLTKTGGHGFGLGVNGGEPTIWPERCINWMNKQNIL